MNTTVRQAASEDAAAIYKIIQQGFARYAQHACPAAAQAALSETESDIYRDIHEKYVLFAECDGLPVGTARLKIADGEAYLSRFAVSVSAQGYGKAIMDAACDYAIENGATAIFLHTAARATETVEFYKSLGFETVSERDTGVYLRLCMSKQLMR